MLTKEDYKNYLNQMKDLETEMIARYKQLADSVEDKKLKEIFNQISEDEEEHSKIVEKIRELIL